MTRRDARRRQFRAAALWGLAGVALIQLALGLAVDQRLTEVRDPEYAHRERLLLDRRAESPDAPLLLVLGSSRVQMGLDAATLGAESGGRWLAFNFGIAGAGPSAQEMCLDRLRETGTRPDVVLIEVMPAFFDASLPDQKVFDGARLSAGELSTVPLPGWPERRILRKWALGRVAPLNRHQAEYRQFVALDQRSDGRPDTYALIFTDEHGWMPCNPPPDEQEARTRLAFSQYAPVYQNYRPSAAQEERLGRLIEACRRDGARVGLLLCPEGSTFRRLASPAMRESTAAMLERLKAKYGVAVIDARDWMEDGFFYDMHHLLPDGAREFSRRLAKEGVAPLLREGIAARARK